MKLRLRKLVLGMSAVAASLAAGANAQAAHDDYYYARVISAEPVFVAERTPVNREVCWEERRHEPARTQPSATPVILGAIIGGIIGNQLGRGAHRYDRQFATAAGAALGGSIGHDAAVHHGHAGGYYAVSGERCTIQREYHSERVLAGYDVTYEYEGRVYQARTGYHPGSRIRVQIDVIPAR